MRRHVLGWRETAQIHTNTHMQAQTHAHKHTGVQWSYVVAQESTFMLLCRCSVHLWRHNDLWIHEFINLRHGDLVNLRFINDTIVLVNYLNNVNGISLSFSLALSLSLTHTHTHTQTHINTHRHSHIRYTYAYSHSTRIGLHAFDTNRPTFTQHIYAYFTHNKYRPISH